MPHQDAHQESKRQTPDPSPPLLPNQLPPLQPNRLPPLLPDPSLHRPLDLSPDQLLPPPLHRPPDRLPLLIADRLPPQ